MGTTITECIFHGLETGIAVEQGSPIGGSKCHLCGSAEAKRVSTVWTTRKGKQTKQTITTYHCGTRHVSDSQRPVTVGNKCIKGSA